MQEHPGRLVVVVGSEETPSEARRELDNLGLEDSAGDLSSGTALEIDSIATLQDRFRHIIAGEHLRCLGRSRSLQSVLRRLKELLVAA